jgi:endogenous inhibitor of DNA gyrase (YacG/DUF329 family)
MTKPRTVACPHCGNPVAWTPAARWRPFCSERCKMIDLGGWASESYRVPLPETPDLDMFGEPDQASGSRERERG